MIPEGADQTRVALIEAGDFGGTCVNRGCIPTKMFVYTADLADADPRCGAFGLEATLDRVEIADYAGDRIAASRADLALSGRQSAIATTSLMDGLALLLRTASW